MNDTDEPSPNAAGNAAAEGLPYIEGSVWSIQFAQTKPGMTKEYLQSLRAEWTPLMDEAKRQNVILDYRILLTPRSNPNDWNVMLMVEVENMAALDGYSEKMDALGKSLRSPEPARRCAAFREILGVKLLREVTLK